MRKLMLGVVAVALAAGCAPSGESEGVDLTAQALRAAEASGYVPDGRDGVLHIYTWCDYIAPDVLSSFERALGVTIKVDTFDSNEAMYAKLKAGGTGYDLITPSSYQIATMVREKMVERLDHKRIPNVRQNFDPFFNSQILDPKFTYNVPYVVTYTGFAYAKDKIPEGVDVATWKVLENPAFNGRISLLDDVREVIGAGLMSLGYSINSTNPKEIDEAVARILKWRGNIRKFDCESYKTEIPGGSSYLGHGYSSDTTQVIAGDEEAGVPARPDIGFALPKEGFTIAFDEFVVSSKATRKDLAYAFINYLYDGDVAKVNMDYVCGPMPVKPGIDQLDAEYRALIMLTPEQLKAGQVLKSFDGQPQVMDLYNKAWDRIKATEAK